MTLYEIDNAILTLINEDGEIEDYEAFEQLQMERDSKIENIALWCKNLDAEATALKAEEERLAERRKSAEAKIKRLRDYLGYALEGEKFETARVAVSWRKSTKVEVDEEQIPAEWCDVVTTFKPKKNDIKAALKEGRSIAGCRLVESNNVQIK